MRVIAGKAKGHRLYAPNDRRVRPALDQVKEAIFNILFDVSDLWVLDLFAGCGSVGIEALSRGAHHATFVEEWKPCLDAIKKNLIHCKLETQASIVRASVERGIARLSKTAEKFNLVFVDPPYEKNLVNPTLKLLESSPILGDDCIIVVEHHPKEPLENFSRLALTDSRKYGQTLVSFLNMAR
jgi:16S rRNA (guanine(966)-N(2))-methyltransferase RsmD